MRSEAVRYLIVPGWQGSGDDHWQSHWQRSLPNSARVEQLDWLAPRQQDWIAALERQIAADPRPAILIAHSLGCVTVARWAAQASTESIRRVRGALLVAPADVERPNCPEALRNFAPIARQALPFPSQLVGSDNDSAASAARAIELARDWGSEVAILSGAGHINVKSGHQRWDQGFAYLFRLQSRIEQQLRLRA
ncbi:MULTISPECIES: alpha/beta hydrolase [unclassified Pseudomonas]|uniref:RBBP9/YdeN family alpha/beta hydrolase n=1 Tax=unclassified Pseudomonas TaxID=196821 RepID=UPI000964DE9C|nr:MULTISPECIES: alpha/beta hydrolase [unclassified Pseudomonas]OLU16443.1 alpha/beta hydrolase [Pseudomonas sp. PA1(2017)]OLU34597.1 alpha/beta hydrolase [Pseudomonas sp. PA27(2017)]